MRVAAAGLGAAVAGPLGGALGGWFAGALGASAGVLVEKYAEKFGDKAGEKLLETTTDALAERLNVNLISTERIVASSWVTSILLRAMMWPDCAIGKGMQSSPAGAADAAKRLFGSVAASDATMKDMTRRRRKAATRCSESAGSPMTRSFSASIGICASSSATETRR